MRVVLETKVELCSPCPKPPPQRGRWAGRARALNHQARFRARSEPRASARAESGSEPRASARAESRRSAKSGSCDARRLFAHGHLVRALVVGLVMGSARATLAADGPVDRFLAALDADTSVPVEARALIRSSWEKCEDCDGEEFLIQGLALFSPGFQAGLDAYDADRYEECVRLMGALRTHDAPFVATNAAVYEIKALIALDRIGEALAGIARLEGGGELATYSYYAAEVAFLRGYGLLADLEYDRARDALNEFMRDFPEASQRLRLSARQMLGELANRRPGQIGEIVDLMDYSGRRLRLGDSGAAVQQRQQRIIALLNRLIEDAEQQEQSSSSSDAGGGSGRSPRRPMPQSRLPEGAAGEQSLREGRRAHPAEAWGSMPPAQRARILQALRDSFPSRYRQLVEQYYEELAKKP